MGRRRPGCVIERLKAEPTALETHETRHNTCWLVLRLRWLLRLRCLNLRLGCWLRLRRWLSLGSGLCPVCLGSRSLPRLLLFHQSGTNDAQELPWI